MLRSKYKGKQLHLNSTDANFDCASIDKQVARIWRDSSTFPSTNVYTCITSDSQGKDISPQDPALSYRAPMSLANIRTIILATIGGVLAITLIAWCTLAYRKRKKRQANRSRVAAQRDNSSVELDDLATVAAYNGHVRRHDSGEQPPRYTRTGKPWETAPLYGKIRSFLSLRVVMLIEI